MIRCGHANLRHARYMPALVGKDAPGRAHAEAAIAVRVEKVL